jgi:hypothetical protein
MNLDVSMQFAATEIKLGTERLYKQSGVKYLTNG